MTKASASYDLDVSDLPDTAKGLRAPIVWGGLLLVWVELTIFALCFASALYLRENFRIWPTRPNPELLWPSIGVGIGLLSCVTVLQTARHAWHDELHATRRWLLITNVLGLLWCGARVMEIRCLPWQWNADAHASTVWLTLGFHTLDIGASLGENIFFAGSLLFGPVEKKAYTDIHINAVLWCVIVLAWLPFYGLFYFGGRW